MTEKKTKRNIKGWIILMTSVVLAFVVLPYAWWKGNVDYNNIKSRGKSTTGTVTDVTGFKENHTRIEYFIDNQKIIVVRDAPSKSKKSIGDNVKLLYDSLDYENVFILW